MPRMRMKARGKDLEFISRINRDGSGTSPVILNESMLKAKYKLNRLSLTKNTFIAIGFNSFVVKLKKEK